MTEQRAIAIGAGSSLKARELALLYLPLFTVALGYASVLPILPTLLERLHDGTDLGSLPLHAGLLTAIYIGAFVIAAPLWGRIVDLRGSRLVLLAGLLGYAASTVWFGFSVSLVGMYATRFAAGAFAAGLFPATAALIVEECHDPERSRHLGWVNAASVVGFLAGPVLTGWIHAFMATRDPTAHALHTTAIPVWTTSLIALVVAMGVAWGLGSRGAKKDHIDSETHIDTDDAVFAKRCILLLSAVAAFGLGAFEVGLSLRSQRLWRWTPTDLGWLFAVCSLVMLAIQLLFFSRLRRYLQLKTLIVGGFMVMAGGFALLANAVTYIGVMTLVAVIAFGSGVLLLALSVATADKAKHRVGLTFGYQNAAGNFGQAAGSAAAGALFSMLPQVSLAIVAILMATAAGVAWWITHMQRDVLTTGLLKP